IGGQLSGEVLDQITLSTAREKGLACDQVIEDVFLWGNVSKLIGAERIGAALAVTENLSYWVLGYGGTLVTAINQIYFAQQMNECVDDKEGYFAHIFVPREVEGQGKSQEIQNSATQEALDGIQAFAGRVQADATDASLSDKALAEATGKVKELVDDARKRDVVEAELRISGASYGGIESKKPIYFWVGPQAELDVSAYSTDGKTVLSNADGDTLTLDNQSGTLTVNGQPVIDSSEADHVRLASTNLSIPAVEVPQRLNAFSLDDSNRFILGINVRGETIVHDPALLDCIRQAVLFQSGVPLNSPVMSEAFGVAETVVTDAYPTISFDPTRNRIVMAGLSAQTASGAAAGVQLFADRTVLVTGAPNPRAGNLNSIIFENGSLVYKPATHELIIWLKHHANAIVSDQEVKDFSGTLTSTSNPTTLCEEPAIDLRVETDPSTPATKLKGDNLTAGLQKNGPFQVFETETKRFILYSKLVEGECKDFFKVIDKLTGEEYDQEINSISQTEDGTIRIQTKDGLDHTLKISDENGKPVLTYDGKSEVLRSASGRGGSFYYDPNRGLYFAENAQFIPLNDQFRNQGLAFQANPDGTASGKAASNVFNINTGQGAPGLFNIPSLPPTIAGLAIALLVLGIVSAGIYVDSRRRKDNEVSSSLV
ncbi:MAG: hypothetical protein U1C71_01650, partial [archaeon]|nr:hypothetical protein [archaeon]